MLKVNKICSVMFDEISLSTNLTYCKLTNSIIGYEDLGSLGRADSFANHALVFMVQSIYSGWKQPIAYYFTKDSVKSKDLSYLIREVIEQLQCIGIKVACTVCDQGPTNRGALKLLKKEANCNIEAPFLLINKQKIVSLHDVPHSLKSIRNALAKYIIKYGQHRAAKFCHLISAFHFDKTRRFQTLRKIRECYLHIDKYKLMKMKVSIDAKTLSNTMAAAIETMIADNTGLPSEAIDTAQFLHEINDFFDSFNSNNISQKHAVPPLRIALTKKNTAHCILENNVGKSSIVRILFLKRWFYQTNASV
ncbi:thap domain-containing protein 9 [Holotrichia oblita]|uniref:Thap domain-containing protein 9 n=1 Tax=Holotrichia oblita TaxID=644536 RepID=A0ACB9TSY7_HOLOL|nr:thap domain-containing protein 9 [Holotrichia oblita]